MTSLVLGRTTRETTATRDLQADPAWAGLYRVGAWAAVATLLFMPIQLIVFIMWPPPSTVEGFFALFRRNAVLGLLDMDLLLLVQWIALGLLFVALFAALRRLSASLLAIAMTLELLAVAAYLASNTALSMLIVSSQHEAAATESERAAALAAGQALLAIYQGTAFDVSYVLSGVAILLVGVALLRTLAFGRPIAYAAIIVGAAGLVPASAGTVGLVLSLISLLPLVVWLVLVARSLFALAARADASRA